MVPSYGPLETIQNMSEPFFFKIKMRYWGGHLKWDTLYIPTHLRTSYLKKSPVESYLTYYITKSTQINSYSNNLQDFTSIQPQIYRGEGSPQNTI